MTIETDTSNYDRPVHARFIRNLTLSVATGAAITFIGAKAADAEPQDAIESTIVEAEVTTTTEQQSEGSKNRNTAGTTLALGGAAIGLALAGRRLSATRV